MPLSITRQLEIHHKFQEVWITEYALMEDVQAGGHRENSCQTPVLGGTRKYQWEVGEIFYYPAYRTYIENFSSYFWDDPFEPHKI
jgi:hypothetical protein